MKMRKIMDRETAEHFYNWLDRYVSLDEQHEVEQAIHALLKNNPELPKKHGWSELREMSRAFYAKEYVQVCHVLKSARDALWAIANMQIIESTNKSEVLALCVSIAKIELEKINVE